MTAAKTDPTRSLHRKLAQVIADLSPDDFAMATARCLGRTHITFDADPCWEWLGARAAKGYGQMSVGGHLDYTHRIAWTLTNGPIPDGLRVLHRCDNPPCVRPDHLFVGTQADNLLDMKIKGRRPLRTHCRYGHTEPLRILWRDGARRCPECAREKVRRARERRQAERAFVA